MQAVLDSMTAAQTMASDLTSRVALVRWSNEAATQAVALAPGWKTVQDKLALFVQLTQPRVVVL